MRIDAQSNGDVVDFIVGEEAASFDFPGVEHLAAQGQDGLGFLVARHFGGAAGGIALDQEQLILGNVGGFAIGEFARQHGDAGLLFLLHLLRVLLPRQGLLDGQFGDGLTRLDVQVEPDLEGVLDLAGDQLHRLA